MTETTTSCITLVSRMYCTYMDGSSNGAIAMAMHVVESL